MYNDNDNDGSDSGRSLVVILTRLFRAKECTQVFHIDPKYKRLKEWEGRREMIKNGQSY
jgi:hypothetical protein